MKNFKSIYEGIFQQNTDTLDNSVYLETPEMQEWIDIHFRNREPDIRRDLKYKDGYLYINNPYKDSYEFISIHKNKLTDIIPDIKGVIFDKSVSIISGPQVLDETVFGKEIIFKKSNPSQKEVYMVFINTREVCNVSIILDNPNNEQTLLYMNGKSIYNCFFKSYELNIGNDFSSLYRNKLDVDHLVFDYLYIFSDHKEILKNLVDWDYKPNIYTKSKREKVKITEWDHTHVMNIIKRPEYIYDDPLLKISDKIKSINDIIPENNSLQPNMDITFSDGRVKIKFLKKGSTIKINIIDKLYR